MPLSPLKEEHTAKHPTECGCSACLEYWNDAHEAKYYGNDSPASILQFPVKEKHRDQ